MDLVEALLHRIEPAVDLERLDRTDLVALRHRGEDGARLHGRAVHQDDAGAAVGGVAAPVGTGEAGRFADEMDEEVAGLDLAGHGLAVDRYRDAHAQTS